jgi:hypothetical protein
VLGHAVLDNTRSATVYISNVGNPADGFVLRLDLSLSPTVKVNSATEIAHGYKVVPNAAAFVFGPTGLVYNKGTDTLYVASTADNAIFAVAKASKLTTPIVRGTKIFGNPPNANLRGPLGMVNAPNGDLIVANGDGVSGDPTQPSEYVEFSKTGTFVSQFNIDPAQGGAFGIDAGLLGDNAPRLAVVDDNVNTLNVFTGLTPSVAGAGQ